MAITVVSGNFNPYTSSWMAVNADSWSDLSTSPFATWSNWTAWNTAPQTVQLRIDDDLGEVKARLAEVKVSYAGSLTVSLKVSNTGSFAGEETTYTFSAGTATNIAKARYYRWTVQVAVSGTIIPEIYQAFALYSDDYVTETQSSVSTSTLSGSITGRVVSHGLGSVYSCSLTPHNNFTWVDRAYALPDAWNETVIAPKASITSLAPLTIVLRDDFGVAVDGTVDITITGTSPVQLTATGVERL